jgi:hypothetical protein
MVLLNDYSPCAQVSLFLVCRLKGVSAGWREVHDLLGPAAPDGTHSFGDIAQAGEKLGMLPLALHAGWDDLANLPMPAILHFSDREKPKQQPHLVVLLKVAADGVYLLDAPYVPYFLPRSGLEKYWTGNVMAFASDEDQFDRIRASAQSFPSPVVLLYIALGILFAVTGGSFICTALRNLARVRSSHLRMPALAVCGAIVLVDIWLCVVKLGSTLPPICDFESDIVDLGELQTGSKSVNVAIRNSGDTPLEIKEISSTCACAVVRGPGTVPPKGSSVINVTIDVGPGPKSAQVTISSNDPKGDRQVQLSWHGKADAYLMPAWIAAPSEPMDQPYERTLRLVYPGGKASITPRLLKCECTSPRIDVREGGNNSAAFHVGLSGSVVRVMGELELLVRVLPPGEPERFDSHCNIFVSYGSEVRQIKLPAVSIGFGSGKLTPDVRAAVFSALTASDLIGQQRTLRLMTRESTRAVEVRGAPAWLRYRIDQESPTVFVLRLTVASDPGESKASTLLVTSADDPTVTTSIRVIAYCASK